MSELEGRNTRFSANAIKLEKKKQTLKLLMCYITEYRNNLREKSLGLVYLWGNSEWEKPIVSLAEVVSGDICQIQFLGMGTPYLLPSKRYLLLTY